MKKNYQSPEELEKYKKPTEPGEFNDQEEDLLGIFFEVAGEKVRELVCTRKGKVLLAATVLGALAVGAAAYGVLAVGKLAVGKAQFDNLEVNKMKIDHLKVKYLEVEEQI